MSQCQFCHDEVNQWDGKQEGYLVASKNQTKNGEVHTHVHGSLEDKNVMEELITTSIIECDLFDNFKKKMQNVKTVKGFLNTILRSRFTQQRT